MAGERVGLASVSRADGGAADAPHVRDGFRAHELREVSRWSLSRFGADEDERGDGYTSCAVAFRRASRPSAAVHRDHHLPRRLWLMTAGTFS